MKKVFMIDGGAGRVIAAIPALERYVLSHPEEDINIVVFGWDNLFWGNQLLQDITFSVDTKGLFDNVFKNADIVVSPEPYKVPDYYNQKISIAQAFDLEINGNISTKENDNVARLYTNKAEEKAAANFIFDVKSEQKKDITIVVQPFGRGAREDRGVIIDDSSRGLDSSAYLKLVKKLSTKYNLILFAEKAFHLPEDKYTAKPELDLRMWMSVIDCADYFVGCDSVGQHMARCCNKPGTVLLGSTFAVNVTYPDWFNIYEKQGVDKKYSPIRVCGFDSHLADRYNDRCMEFSDDEIEEMFLSIVEDIENKVK